MVYFCEVTEKKYISIDKERVLLYKWLLKNGTVYEYLK